MKKILSYVFVGAIALAGATVVSCSSDDSVAVVLQTGKVTGIASGSTVLTLTVGEATSKCIIHVS